MSSSVQRSFARQRLLNEFRSVQEHISKGEFADQNGAPALLVHLVNSDVFHWHVIISPQQGHFQGLRLHATMEFSEGFPSSPPRIALDTNIPHCTTSHFENTGSRYYPWGMEDEFEFERPYPTWICLDLILSAGSQQPFANAKWTPAYSVSALLRQFQAFLSDEWVGGWFFSRNGCVHEHGVASRICFDFSRSFYYTCSTAFLRINIKNRSVMGVTTSMLTNAILH